MARSLIPDPLELLRQAVNRLEGRANALAGRGLEVDQVVKTMHQLSSGSLVLRQAMELALDGFYKRLNLPSSREFADMKATLHRVEGKLDSLLATQQGPRSVAAPARTRRPPAKAAPEPAPAPAPKPRKTATRKTATAARSRKAAGAGAR